MAQSDARSPEISRRRAVLDTLRAAPGPLGVTELAEQIGVHPNTVRFHLDALVSAGAVDRAGEQRAGRGRPRTVYSPRPGIARDGQREYRLLAEILLSRLASDSTSDTEAVDTGRAWGKHLITRIPPFHRPTTQEAVARLTTMLAELGFDPEMSGDDAATSRIRLRNCPFLELAEEYTETVCPLHLGLMQGALTEIDAPIQTTHLEPFAEPGACLAHLATTEDARAPTRSKP